MNSDDKYVLIGLSKYAKIVHVCIQVILTSVNIALAILSMSIETGNLKLFISLKAPHRA
jgi:hypothetical protein